MGVGIGAWLTARWQHRRWILDNKKVEYRELLDALNTYRWRLLNYQATYGDALIVGDSNEEPKAQSLEKIALAKAETALSNALGDRIFIREELAVGSVSEDYRKFSSTLLSDKPPTISKASQVLAGFHRKLVGIAETDLRLPGRFRKGK